MADKSYLRTSKAADASAAGLFGKPLHLFHAQVTRALGAEIGPKAALLFAEPVGGSGLEIDWYTEAEGEIRPFSDTDEDERARAAAQLSMLYARIIALRDRLLASSEPSEQQLGNLLASASGWPRPSETYLVGDQAVTISWALGIDREGAEAPIIDAALAEHAASPAGEMPDEAPAKDAPAAESVPAPSPTDFETETRTLPPPTIYAVAGQRLARLVLAGAAALLAGAGGFYGYSLWSAERAKAAGDADGLAAEQGQLNERLARLRRELLRKRLECNAPAEGIVIPPDAAGTGDLRFLAGHWANMDEIHLVDQPALKLKYSMTVDSSGKGTFLIDVSDGRTCRAPLSARFDASDKLVIETLGGLPCSGGDYSIKPQRVVCSASARGKTDCQVVNVGANSFRAEFRRREQ